MAEKIPFRGDHKLRWIQERDCFLTYLDADTKFSDAKWDAWLRELAAAPGGKAMLCAWGDILPSKDQWKRLTTLLRQSSIKVAVVTESKQTSAMAKAASWLGIEIKAFRWEQIYDASLYISLDGEARLAVRAAITALRDSYGVVVGSAEFGGSPASVAADPPAPARPSTPSRSTVVAFEARARSSKPLSSPSSGGVKSGTKKSRTPMADAASHNLERVRRNSEEIQARLAEIQARLRNRSQIS